MTKALRRELINVFVNVFRTDQEDAIVSGYPCVLRFCRGERPVGVENRVGEGCDLGAAPPRRGVLGNRQDACGLPLAKPREGLCVGVLLVLCAPRVSREN